MRGHIAKKGNNYYAVIYEGTNPATGKPRHRWHRAGSTKREAERVLTDLVKRHHNGDYRPPEKITLGEYLDRWLPTQRQPLAPSTYSSYRANIRLHVRPYIGSIPIQRLTPEDLDDLYAVLLTNGRRNKGGGQLSAKTVGWCMPSSTRRSPTPTARDRWLATWPISLIRQGSPPVPAPR